MNALDKFKNKVNLPAAFGEAQPYVRLAYVDESETAGADADVEFDGDAGHVTVKVTEWQKVGTEVVRDPGIRLAVFDLATGAVIGSNSFELDIDEVLSALLTAVEGMRVLGEGA